MKDIPFDTEKRGRDGKVLSSSSQKEKKYTPSIMVTVNGETVRMPEKDNPIFVDVFDVYPFDMSKMGGTKLITRINGADRDFTEPLHEGDRIEDRKSVV